MKKKGFTLVELLAVIAILAILVIVAMPNVLGMFNQAKSSTFVTEVQTYMDAAKTQFISDAMYQTGTKTYTTGQLKMDGAEKKYSISFDQYGNFTSVAVWDDNFCYNSTQLKGGKTWVATAEDKESIKVEDIHLANGGDAAAACGDSTFITVD